ncbi:sulfatase-like hydrolase/transferase [bacterium]|nr:sulfatase-like hydrolase/transferase [bacterium]
MKTSRPNILVVMTDHQRGDTVLPEHPARTPHLTDFAKQGLAFTNAFCPSPHCCPARATFFTGLYPSRHGVWNNICNDQRLSRGPRPGTRLWSEDLAAAGYTLAFSGKWHVSIDTSPKDHGWNELLATSKGGDFHGVSWDTYRKWASQPEPAERPEGHILRQGYGTARTYGTAPAEWEQTNQDRKATNIMLDWLGSPDRRREPWCAFLGLSGPHDPYVVPSKYLDMYRLDDVPLPPSYRDTLADKPNIYRRMRETRFGQLGEREVRDAIRHFWAYCTYLDELFGEVLRALDATGQADNTLVVYTADHADYCGDHGLFAKGIPCFRGAYHVPAIIRWPRGMKARGRRSDAFVSLADFGPTFLDVAGVSSDAAFTGSSLYPHFSGASPEKWRDDIHTQSNGVELYYSQRSVMTKEFKYVFNGFDFDELYDLRTDPHEMNNVAQNPAYKNVLLDMCRRMWRFALREQDAMINNYVTVALAPYGPMEAFR